MSDCGPIFTITTKCDLPVLSVILVIDGNGLSGTTVDLTCVHEETGHKITKSCTVVNPTTGLVEAAFSKDDLSVGYYRIQWQVTYVNNKVVTVPNTYREGKLITYERMYVNENFHD
jgi:hypothetical protein